MSAFMVTTDHIDALLTAGLRFASIRNVTTIVLILLLIVLVIAAVITVMARLECRSVRARYQGRRDQAINRLDDSDHRDGAVTEYLDSYRHANCGVCGTTAATFRNGICTSCTYWHNQIGELGALIITGDLYFIGPEPTRTDLLANPKRFGCYGTGFRIRHANGTETVTHNLGHCGTIPAALRPADNAAFIGEPEHIPTPTIPAHNHADYLDYIGGSYPYECLRCYLRFASDNDAYRDVPPTADDVTEGRGPWDVNGRDAFPDGRTLHPR